MNCMSRHRSRSQTLAGIQFRFSLSPVIVRAPIADESLELRQLHALGLIGDGLLGGPPCRQDAPAGLGRGAAIDTMTAATSPTWIDFMATLLAVGATGRGDDIMAFGQCRFRYRAPQANRAAGYKPCLFHRYLGIDDYRGVGALFYSAKKARC